MSCANYRQIPEITPSELELHINYLASDELQGRYPGTDGDLAASGYIEKWFNTLGLEVGRQEFSFTKSVKPASATSFLVNGKPLSSNHYSPFGFSRDTVARGKLVFGGYGITVKADSFEWDDYKGLDVKGKWILIFRGYPHNETGDNYLSLASDDRDKAMLAADNGAAGIILVSGYNFDPSDRIIKVERKIAPVGIPVFQITRSSADSILGLVNLNLKQIEDKGLSETSSEQVISAIEIEARSQLENIPGFTGNVFGILKGTDPELSREYIVLGAHYDHLGIGGNGSSSRRQDTIAVHNGADDNASGVAMMLELAGKLKDKRHLLKRSFIFAAFGAEEMGLLGSKYFVNNMPVDPSAITAMINLDMVGRLDTVKGIQVSGTGTSVEADSLIKQANNAGIKLRLGTEGSGPSDHSSFYGKNIPVFFITTGAHSDYHTPSDDANRINYDGMVMVSDFTDNLLSAIAVHSGKIHFREAGPKETASGPGYRFKVTLGFMPDFSSTDIEGVRVDFVTKGKAAERGGIKNGDIITAIDGLPVKNIYDYMYRLGKLSRNQIISVEVLRNEIKEVLLIQL